MLNRFKAFFLSLLTVSSTTLATQGSCSEPIQETQESCSEPIRETQESCSELIQETQNTTPCCFYRPLFQVKAGYFFFANSKMRKIYDRGGLDIQLCASYPLSKLSCRWTLNAYGAVEYLQCSGRSINGHQKTFIWSVPINIGLQPVYAINDKMQYYFAIGPRYFYIHQRNCSFYVNKNKSKNGLGFFVNTGFNYFLCDRLVVDVFGEYSYAKTHFHSGKPRVYTRNIQIGGFTFGGGLGYKF